MLTPTGKSAIDFLNLEDRKDDAWDDWLRGGFNSNRLSALSRGAHRNLVIGFEDENTLRDDDISGCFRGGQPHVGVGNILPVLNNPVVGSKRSCGRATRTSKESDLRGRNNEVRASGLDRNGRRTTGETHAREGID